MKKASIWLAALLAAGCVYACSSHDDDGHAHGADAGHESQYPTCRIIMDACHELDTGDGPIHDCHEVAHGATSDDPCVAKKDECLKTCVAPADGGSSDAHDPHADH